MVRPRMLRRIEREPAASYYKPQGIPITELEECVLPLEGLEALRLVDVDGLDQETASQRMAISKATFCRVLAEARKTVALALTKGMALRIAGGHHFVDAPGNKKGIHGHCPRGRAKCPLPDQSPRRNCHEREQKK